MKNHSSLSASPEEKIFRVLSQRLQLKAKKTDTIFLLRTKKKNRNGVFKQLVLNSVTRPVNNVIRFIEPTNEQEF